MDRSIIHLNIADFAVAVERAIDPRLRKRPLIVAPTGAVRAAVYDMSEEAYAAGVRKGMALRRAVRLLPDADILAPYPDRYERAMRAVLKRTLSYTPLIEPGEDDGHFFLDVSGTSRLFGPPVDVAWRLQRRIKTDLGLDPIWSVAPNKLVAKVATRLVKPIGEYIVAAGDEDAFLAPLPIGLVPGIDAVDRIRLREFNLQYVHQAAALTRAQLEIPFGRKARFVYDTLRGIDPSPVMPVGQKPPRVTIDHTFDEDSNEKSVMEATLYRMTERAGADLRRRNLAARRVCIVLDHSDGVRRIRQKRLQPACCNDLLLFEAARAVLHLGWTRRVRIRRLRLICDRLVFPPAQLPLFATERRTDAKRNNLVSVIDRIRQRYGDDSIRLGRTLAA